MSEDPGFIKGLQGLHGMVCGPEEPEPDPQDEIDRLCAELAEKDKRIARAMNLLDRALGDTDPDIEPDEHEDPVYWAMRALTGGSDD